MKISEQILTLLHLRLLVIFIVASLLQACKIPYVQAMLSKFSFFRRKNPIFQCLTTVLISLFMQFVILLFLPVITKNLLPYSTTNFYELTTQFLIITSIILTIELILLTVWKCSTNCCYCCDTVLEYIFFCCTTIFSTCAAISAIFVCLEN